MNQAHENASGPQLTEIAISVSNGQEEQERNKVQYLAETTKPPLPQIFLPIELRHLLQTERLY